MNSTTTTIRERGQLTLPQKIRDSLPWLKPNHPVTITTSPTAIIITPPQTQVKPDWDFIWNQIDIVSNFPGQQGNLSEFIAEDRQRH